MAAVSKTAVSQQRKFAALQQEPYFGTLRCRWMRALHCIKTGNLELIDEGQIKGDRWAGGLTLASAFRQPRGLFDQHNLGRGNVIGLGSLPFYCPRDAGSRLS